MSLLLPLGLLALLSLLVLLLIYLLKPNYQQKLISSTFVWKLSLKYKKKQIPISKLRNLLIILCQILIFVLAALVISEPAKVNEIPVQSNECVLIIDGSASMLTTAEGSTRFERAINKAKATADEFFDANGVVSVVLAGPESQYVVQRASSAERAFVTARLDGLKCTYGTADVEGAVALAEETLGFNPDAQIKFITGSTGYIASGNKIEMDYVNVEGEWNVGILGVTAELENGYYTIEVEVCCYGRDVAVELCANVTGANVSGSVGTGVASSLPNTTLFLESDKVVRVVYTAEAREWGENTTLVALTDAEKMYSFENIFFHIDNPDSYMYDNEYYLYGGIKPTVRVQYCSTDHTNFMTGVLLQQVGYMRDRWTMEVKQTDPDTMELSGYDFYIFEHKMPSVLPDDGIVFMVDPDRSAGAGFDVGQKVVIKDYAGNGVPVSPGAEHPIMSYIDTTAFLLTSYTKVSQDTLNPDYKVLMYYEGNPLFFVCNTDVKKVMVLAMSFSHSDSGINMNFPMLMANIFNYFLPATFDSPVYSVFDTVDFNARGSVLTVKQNSSADDPTEFTEFPAQIQVNEPGTYTVSQTLMSGGDQLVEQFYVRLNSKLSNIFGAEYVISAPETSNQPTRTYEDLLIYFAAAMIALLFIEWFLQSRNNI